MEGQGAQVQRVINNTFVNKPSSSYVTIFRDDSDGLYYGKLANGTVEAIGGGGGGGNGNINGAIDLSTNPNYPVAVKGTAWVVSVAGKIGGASGVYAPVGSLIWATASGVAGDQATVGFRWVLIVWTGSLWEVGNDQFARPQQKYNAVNSVLKMGSWGADGDPTTINTEGGVWFGVNANGVQTAAEGGYARIKPDRIGIAQIITGVNGNALFYGVRLDYANGIILKDNLAATTFEANRNRGTMRTSKGITAARPAAVNVGEQWFDTALGANGGKPIWFVGGGLWVDASGALV